MDDFGDSDLFYIAADTEESPKDGDASTRNDDDDDLDGPSDPLGALNNIADIPPDNTTRAPANFELIRETDEYNKLLETIYEITIEKSWSHRQAFAAFDPAISNVAPTAFALAESVLQPLMITATYHQVLSTSPLIHRPFTEYFMPLALEHQRPEDGYEIKLFHMVWRYFVALVFDLKTGQIQGYYYLAVSLKIAESIFGEE